MHARRELVFERIDDIMPEVERLLAGHATCRGWTLGQVLRHLAVSVRLSLVGRPVTPDPELVRDFDVRRRRFFRSGVFPEGVEVPLPILLPPADADARVEAESLRDALGRLAASDGPFSAHPWLGPLSKQEWSDFHRIHCAHHLGFARIAGPG